MSSGPRGWCPRKRRGYVGPACPWCTEPHEKSEGDPALLRDILQRMNIRGKLIEFHNAMEVPVLETPTIPAEERIKLRASLIAEEFFEVMEAMFKEHERFRYAKDMVFRCIKDGHSEVDMLELADGLCDLDYVVEGTRLEFGIDGGPVLEEVHAANMRKVGGPVREDGKRLKPPGWKPPDIKGVLQKQGWGEQGDENQPSSQRRYDGD